MYTVYYCTHSIKVITSRYCILIVAAQLCRREGFALTEFFVAEPGIPQKKTIKQTYGGRQRNSVEFNDQSVLNGSRGHCIVGSRRDNHEFDGVLIG
jgi:hypothetical protein